VKPTIRPSGRVIRDSFDNVEAGGAIPANVVEDGLAEDFDVRSLNQSQSQRVLDPPSGGELPHAAVLSSVQIVQ